MTASYSMARTSGPELSIDGAPSRKFSMSLKAAWAPSLDCNLSTSWLANRYAPSSHQVWALRWNTCITIKNFQLVCMHVCMHMSRYLSETKQQLVCLQKMSVFGLQSSIKSITIVAKLIAPLHNKSHGVVVTSWQLVSMKDDDLSPSHHLLMKPTKTHRKIPYVHFVFMANTTSTRSSVITAVICRYLLTCVFDSRLSNLLRACSVWARVLTDTDSSLSWAIRCFRHSSVYTGNRHRTDTLKRKTAFNWRQPGGSWRHYNPH